jgi:hypothetical protein
VMKSRRLTGFPFNELEDTLAHRGPRTALASQQNWPLMSEMGQSLQIVAHRKSHHVRCSPKATQSQNLPRPKDGGARLSLGANLGQARNDSRESAGAFCCLSATPLAARAGNECRASLSPAPRLIPRKQLGGRSPARLILATDAGRIRSTVDASSCALRSLPVLHSTPPWPRKSGR